ncbi:cell division ATP-binding protein FtsE [Azovibrio restrictus]|uniref:cell division ATP-binding protein FtsE n=1 Tax=Azovibrio restrictus TaxID=146938 RepID=UPI0004292429|nr:ATP-binding cassette domain-containing protein [Azovibrio restrictus]MDD3485017.1 ATP-binding cassette domain-containing protein [Azovibrio restrictus]
MIVGSHLTKRYPGGYEAIKDLGFEIAGGDMVFISGHSGAGKTTLLKLMGAIERPTSGSLIVNGQNLTAMRRAALPYLRRNLGLIFQDQKLLFDRSALDNVLLPLEIIGLHPREAQRRARAALDKVGLLEREKANPIALSGGEQQRLAIARAVVNRPTILLADEPTANLDPESARQVLDLFVAFNQVRVTVIIATHAPHGIPGRQPRLITLDHGRLAP